MIVEKNKLFNARALFICEYASKNKYLKKVCKLEWEENGTKITVSWNVGFFFSETVRY